MQGALSLCENLSDNAYVTTIVRLLCAKVSVACGESVFGRCTSRIYLTARPNWCEVHHSRFACGQLVGCPVLKTQDRCFMITFLGVFVRSPHSILTGPSRSSPSKLAARPPPAHDTNLSSSNDHHGGTARISVLSRGGGAGQDSVQEYKKIG